MIFHEPQHQNTILWQLCAYESHNHDSIVPPYVITLKPDLHETTLAPELALLLPTNKSFESVCFQPSINMSNYIMGVFLANPIFHLHAFCKKYPFEICKWVTNFPSVCQYEQNFQQQLESVHMGYNKELQMLSDLQKHGYKIRGCHR